MDNSDTWKDIQALKSRQSSFREKLLKRKKEREEIVLGITGVESVTTGSCVKDVAVGKEDERSALDSPVEGYPGGDKQEPASEQEIEAKLLLCLLDVALDLPLDSRAIVAAVTRSLDDVKHVPQATVDNFLKKFAAQAFISIKESKGSDGKECLSIISAEHSKLHAFSLTLRDRDDSVEPPEKNQRLASLVADDDIGKASVQDSGGSPENNPTKTSVGTAAHPALRFIGKTTKEAVAGKTDDLIENLLNLPSTREKESKKVGEEILDLLSKPTAKERSLVEKFKSQGGASVQEYCPHGTAAECRLRASQCGSAEVCGRLHFKKILQKHTDETLGDCSFLNTCFHMDTCKYVHYQVDISGHSGGSGSGTVAASGGPGGRISTGLAGELEKPVAILQPPQWIQCDLRFFDMRILGKFSVIMADPPWDIHMELPYGTMSDDEMRQLNIPCLQDEGLIFLWVTGRAMELGRECLKLWGYDRCDEIIWVKTNQLQRIIRTGRTGHWLNHGKEHCLVGMKGDPTHINRWLDCDVIVAEVRATSHKPDEIYGIIERLSPGTRKIELFGRPHNIQPNWMTLGNQLDGVRLNDQDIIEDFRRRYPDGNCMHKPPPSQGQSTTY
ncbi:N6-adenosine-methyltransferase 70 kDa subunit-like [Varroa jacobsoni]|uniref:mRNA m(6)A methyltransferase n=1 Tax=Varroa destructor TaxID=109461 RepID=A0A7M7JLJ7_VARDE|nr:N6-adenosine-methyltransferase 70 kDa subunit-like [Varroa destructor]XP_022654033.1 N6-adenosine-methyltransferase 70 kDa subunit-like [Varroa destructor]XP_022654034.1 N6-adenosine-methyltransferase 70 kDa subunit-like [Varroa destructor]XP_022654036.1 N6-adenosine-methyltransferase 70 kDa subunit-like [Varroa destructor]XP_022654037.1 N6-adenosine-methyltransferase 70 kDa subunit-like [Varroa destructor]XP_022654038.1 N6-adenosine-methyltransferase 70 kDa subunit-like [Varroa destructor]